MTVTKLRRLTATPRPVRPQPATRTIGVVGLNLIRSVDADGKRARSCTIGDRHRCSYWSRLTTRVRDGIARQSGRLARLRPSLAPAPTLGEAVNVLFP
jgi:hypothetical protein